jgi:hypothetical protein
MLALFNHKYVLERRKLDPIWNVNTKAWHGYISIYHFTSNTTSTGFNSQCVSSNHDRMKRLVNYKFYKEFKGWNDYKNRVFLVGVANVKLLITIKRDKWRWIQEVHRQETGRHTTTLSSSNAVLMLWTWNPIMGWIKYSKVMNIQDA